jgi:hypothetical protein
VNRCTITMRPCARSGSCGIRRDFRWGRTASP